MIRGVDPCCGWAHCASCGGVCSTDDSDRRPYKTGLAKQVPRETYDPATYLDRFRNYQRTDKKTTNGGSK